MNISIDLTLQLEYIVALICGVAILIKPKLLNYIIAIYLIVVGIVGILGIKVS